MANPDLINGGEENSFSFKNKYLDKAGIVAIVILFFVILICFLVYVVYGEITGKERPHNESTEPNCYYAGDEYVCD